MAKEVKNKNNRHFWKDFKAELKKVIWPTPKQLLNSTTAVITIVLITAIIVFVLDLAFETVNKHGVNRLKSVVSNTTQNNIDNTTNNLDNNTVTNNTTNTTVNDINDGNTVQNNNNNTLENTVTPENDANQVQ